jgi:ring-1,2-phenylacetyl-CoA epoxidase subunit PaaE
VVERVEPLTGDSAAITFAVPGELARAFAFAPGQSITIRRGGQRRSYSICSPAGSALRIGVREVAGGAVSGWLVRQVKPGDVVQAQVPGGTFSPDVTAAAAHVLIAAGSGITPLLSIAASVLAGNAASTVTLLYGNRRSGTVMFADEVADLKDAHLARMQLVHVLSREPQEAGLHSGRLDRGRLARLLPVTVSPGDVGHWWLCGPPGLAAGAMAVLAGLGVSEGRVHRELFRVGEDPPAPPARGDAPAGPGAAVTVVLGGRSSTFTLPAGISVLDGAQRVRSDLPFACKGGVCGTCRARVTRGGAVMRRNYALEPHEVTAGYVLTCQARPDSDEITVDYDA